eukprot:gene2086-1958_t
MGQTLKSWFLQVFSIKVSPSRIIMVGLDNAGKTTILYNINGESRPTIPTLGFNVETLKINNITLTIWDLGGQESVRRLWKHYYLATKAVIFVVDSTDQERMEETAKELHYVLESSELKNATVLIFANKNDVKDSLGVDEISKLLELESIKQKWKIQSSCGLTGDGIKEGLKWMSNQL